MTEEKLQKIRESLEEYSHLAELDKECYTIFIDAIDEFVSQNHINLENVTNKKLKITVDNTHAAIERLAFCANYELLKDFQNMLVSGCASKIFDAKLTLKEISALLRKFSQVFQTLGLFMPTIIDSLESQSGIKPLRHKIIEQKDTMLEACRKELENRISILDSHLSSLEYTKGWMKGNDYEIAKLIYTKTLEELR